jgi:hypothetical protein
MKQVEVAELVTMLTLAFPRPVIQEGTMRLYEKMLIDLDKDKAHAAVARLIGTAKFLPTIAEIRSASADLVMGPRRVGAEAWGDVNEAVRKFGRYRAPVFSDPIVAECVRCFGWQSICDSTNDIADRARFVELYDQLAARVRSDQVAGPSLALPAPKDAPQRHLASLTAKLGNGGEDMCLECRAKNRATPPSRSHWPGCTLAKPGDEELI